MVAGGEPDSEDDAGGKETELGEEKAGFVHSAVPAHLGRTIRGAFGEAGTSVGDEHACYHQPDAHHDDEHRPIA